MNIGTTNIKTEYQSGNSDLFFNCIDAKFLHDNKALILRFMHIYSRNFFTYCKQYEQILRLTTLISEYKLLT